jgi:hypothetical protein
MAPKKVIVPVVVADSESEPESEELVESEDEAEAEAEVLPKDESDDDSEAEAEDESEDEAEPEAEVLPKDDSEAEAEDESEDEAEPEPAPKPEPVVLVKVKKATKKSQKPAVIVSDDEDVDVVDKKKRAPRKVPSLDEVLALMQELKINEAKAKLEKFIEKFGSAGGKAKRGKKVLAEGEEPPVKKLSAYNLFVQKTLKQMKVDNTIIPKERMRECMVLWRAHKETLVV